jgi:Flp pilus assembly pilin Flp
MKSVLRKLWQDDQGQDLAEYAVLLAVCLVLVIGAVYAIGNNATTFFVAVAEKLHWS